MDTSEESDLTYHEVKREFAVYKINRVKTCSVNNQQQNDNTYYQNNKVRPVYVSNNNNEKSEIETPDVIARIQSPRNPSVNSSWNSKLFRQRGSTLYTNTGLRGQFNRADTIDGKPEVEEKEEKGCTTVHSEANNV